MRIRDEGPDDAEAVRDVVARAFGQPDEADLVDRLRRDGDFEIALVSLDDGGRVSGHVLLSRLVSPSRALALAPVSVLPELQGQGIGSDLVRTGLARARAAGWAGAFVLGDPGYYGRFGFDAALAQGFASPYAGPYLMLLPFSDDMAQAGDLIYPSAFSALG